MPLPALIAAAQGIEIKGFFRRVARAHARARLKKILRRNEADAFVLSAALTITIAGVEQQTAESLVRAADVICPYSNAIRGNVDVAMTVSVR